MRSFARPHTMRTLWLSHLPVGLSFRPPLSLSSRVTRIGMTTRSQTCPDTGFDSSTHQDHDLATNRKLADSRPAPWVHPTYYHLFLLCNPIRHSRKVCGRIDNAKNLQEVGNLTPPAEPNRSSDSTLPPFAQYLRNEAPAAPAAHDRHCCPSLHACDTRGLVLLFDATRRAGIGFDSSLDLRYAIQQVGDR
jgi:hypothetical protein